GEQWLVARRRIEGPNGKVQEGKHPSLVLVAAVTLKPARATLHTMALALGATSFLLWLAAALISRRLCRRALLPVRAMASTARTLGANTLDQRLPLHGTNDELEELGQAFNGLLDRLQEAFERQRRFTGDASHQLRTPLTALLGLLEVTLRHPRSPEDYR